jgi:glycogen synthase
VKHLLICPEYPPAPQPPGGIGTYVVNIARLMAEAGETVHVIGPRWSEAPRDVEETCGGRLILHRVPMDEPLAFRAREHGFARRESALLARWGGRAQRFAWPAALLAERLVETEGIDLIEAQDFDAPLYFFQLRRALGLGPPRTPPCMVHIHSPAEMIFRANGWAPDTEFLRAKRMEDYSIAAADVILCASRYLAAQSEPHYGLEPGSINVLPYPVGDTPELLRSDAVWRDGVICYFGRMEPRKGVIEWAEAAVRIADEFPDSRFMFVGADQRFAGGSTVRGTIWSMIPQRLRSRFIFHDSQSRPELMELLRTARIAVVPSRWENFPNTCIEAMRTGLPVLASPEGGMAEMVEDGRSGWIAPGADPLSLAAALRRALSTGADELRSMGAAAAHRIRELCDNDATVRRHIDLRERVAQTGVARSSVLPASLPRVAGAPARMDAGVDRPGVGVVLLSGEADSGLEETLQSVRTQTLQPAAVVLVTTDRPNTAQQELRARLATRDVVTVEVASPSASEAMRRGAHALTVRLNGRLPEGIVFLDGRDRLEPAYLERAAQILRRNPDVGLLSPWTLPQEERAPILSAPCPEFPYQLLYDDTAPATVFRTSAFLQAVDATNHATAHAARWDVANAVMAAGAKAVTLPGVHALRRTEGDVTTAANPLPHYVRAGMLARVPGAAREHGAGMTLLREAGAVGIPGETHVLTAAVPLTPRRVLRLSLAEQKRLLRKAAGDPLSAARWIMMTTQVALRRATSRLRRSAAP